MLASGLAAQQTPLSSISPADVLPIVHVQNGKNSATAQRAHFVVLVSLDGFRWDYAERFGAKNLLALGASGVSAPQGMVPSYPSLTFPNHYTIVTGLYPEHHGIVANNFIDQTTHARFAMTDENATADGAWYGGTPLWSLAESQGMRTASLMWPGSQAKIAGFRPSYYLPYNHSTSETARIDQIRQWLRLPDAERPHLILVYYSHPDHEGHEFGPDARETRTAALRMDALIGKLRAVLDASALPVDLVVLSDHGMVKLAPDTVLLDQFADFSGFKTAAAQIYGNSEADRNRVYQQLKHASDRFSVYRRKDVPAYLHNNENARAGDPIVVATGAYAIHIHRTPARAADHAPTVGAHGFDPRIVPEMKASFFAAGPDIVVGKTLAPFENVNVYAWIAHLLGLKPAENDGSLSVLSKTLRDAQTVQKGKQR